MPRGRRMTKRGSRKRPLYVTKGQKLELLAAGSRGKFIRRRFTTQTLPANDTTSNSFVTTIGFNVGNTESTVYLQGMIRAILVGQTLSGATGTLPGLGHTVLWCASKMKFLTSGSLPMSSVHAIATMRAWFGFRKSESISIVSSKVLMCPSTVVQGAIPIAFEHKIKLTKLMPGEVMRFFFFTLGDGQAASNRQTLRLSTFQWWSTYSAGEDNLTPATEAASSGTWDTTGLTDTWLNPTEGGA